MQRSLVDLLVCPECKSSLTLRVEEETNGDIRTGRLRCARHEYPVVRSVPRFVAAESYAESFSRQRRAVRRHLDDYRRASVPAERFLTQTGFAQADLTNGLSLEVGCGYGRYLEVLSRLGGQVVGIDLSTDSIDLAYDFIGADPNVHLVQCDLFRLPFRTAQFARVFSLGVLHHTPETRLAFLAIAPYLRPGGQLSIWVYHPRLKVDVDRWRPVTTRLPHAVLYGWCVLNQALFSWARAMPGGGRLCRLLPGEVPRPGRTFWQRVLTDFDALAPRYAHSHTADEVRVWFREAGLSEIRSLTRETAVTGIAEPSPPGRAVRSSS